MAFRQEDYVQAVKAAIDAGLKVYRTEIHWDGRIVIHHEGYDDGDEDDPPPRPGAQAEPTEHPDEPAPMPEVFTPKTLAAFWECSEATVRNMIRRGSLRSFSLGGKLIRIRADEVLAFEERRRAGKPRDE